VAGLNQAETLGTMMICATAHARTTRIKVVMFSDEKIFLIIGRGARTGGLTGELRMASLARPPGNTRTLSRFRTPKRLTDGYRNPRPRSCHCHSLSHCFCGACHAIASPDTDTTMRTKTLLAPGAGEPGGPPVPPPAGPPAQPSTPPPAPPPAATDVTNATRTERELQLEADLEAERKAKKKRETRISELEDENHQLKSIPRPPAPPPPPAADEEIRWRPFKL
jgi:hypothetical protein